MGIMFLAGLGLILLIYFGSTISVDGDITIESVENSTELVDEVIVISGKTYSSKKEAKNKLTGVPQSQMTDEERDFYESYQD